MRIEYKPTKTGKDVWIVTGKYGQAKAFSIAKLLCHVAIIANVEAKESK